jgi:hypothetical protein
VTKQRIFVEKGKVWYRDRRNKVTELEILGVARAEFTASLCFYFSVEATTA